MSIQEFKSAIKSRAYRTWFARIKDSILVETATDLRESQQTASKTSFYITEQTIKDIIKSLSSKEASDEAVAGVVNNLKAYFNSKRIKEIQEPYINGSGIYFPRVSFDTIKRILEKGFKDIENPANTKIFDLYQRGHVFGIATKTLEQSIEKLSYNDTIDPKHKQMLLEVLESIHSKLENEDLATSNLGSTEYTLYAKYKKKKFSYLVELQLKEVNEKAGRETAPILNAIRRYFDPDKLSVSEKLDIKFRKEDEFFKELITSKGSPSLLDMIQESIISTLKNEKDKQTEYSIQNVVVNKVKHKVSNQKVNATIKQQKQSIKNLQNKLRSIPIRTTKGQFYSLANLQFLMDTLLSDTVKENMGAGNRRDILNLRTGRFAESVKVQRFSVSREGMITAFYTYMRYPYATFEPGGRQGYPRSRDPKLLISKSIKEVAATKVANRMRAVLV